MGTAALRAWGGVTRRRACWATWGQADRLSVRAGAEDPAAGGAVEAGVRSDDRAAVGDFEDGAELLVEQAGNSPGDVDGHAAVGRDQCSSYQAICRIVRRCCQERQPDLRFLCRRVAIKGCRLRKPRVVPARPSARPHFMPARSRRTGCSRFIPLAHQTIPIHRPLGDDRLARLDRERERRRRQRRILERGVERRAPNGGTVLMTAAVPPPRQLIRHLHVRGPHRRICRAARTGRRSHPSRLRRRTTGAKRT